MLPCSRTAHSNHQATRVTPYGRVSPGKRLETMDERGCRLCFRPARDSPTDDSPTLESPAIAIQSPAIALESPIADSPMTDPSTTSTGPPDSQTPRPSKRAPPSPQRSRADRWANRFDRSADLEASPGQPSPTAAPDAGPTASPLLTEASPRMPGRATCPPVCRNFVIDIQHFRSKPLFRSFSSAPPIQSARFGRLSLHAISAAPDGELRVALPPLASSRPRLLGRRAHGGRRRGHRFRW